VTAVDNRVNNARKAHPLCTGRKERRPVVKHHEGKHAQGPDVTLG
jgi:hypothetical protein